MGERKKEKVSTPPEEVMAFPVTLDLKGEEMPSHTPSLRTVDPEVEAAARPGHLTNANTVKLNRTNSTTMVE